MNPVLTKRPKMFITGLLLKTSFEGERNKKEIPPFFHKVLEEGKFAEVPGRTNANQLCLFGMKRNQPDFDYLMGVEVRGDAPIPDGMEQRRLPASVYESLRIVKRGPEDVSVAFGHLYKTWIPKSVYVPTGEPAFVYYENDFWRIYNEKGYAGNPEATLYVPIRRLFVKKW